MELHQQVKPWGECSDAEKSERVARARAARFGGPAARRAFRKSVKVTGVEKKAPTRTRKNPPTSSEPPAQEKE